MKTPREVLLAQHAAVTPKLDDLRHTVLRDLVVTPPLPRHSVGLRLLFGCLSCPHTLWRELVLPCRRVWTGLAMIWGLLLLLHVAQRDPVSCVTGQPVLAAPVMMSQEVQQRWVNDLLADRVAPPPEADRPHDEESRPRTEAGKRLAA